MNSSLEKAPAEGERSKTGEWRAFLELTVLAVAGGLLISLYVILIAHMTARKSVEAPVQDAALLAAKQLGRVTVEDPHFGRVGLYDEPAQPATSTGSAPAPTVGINSLFATIRVDLEIARQLKQPVMIRLASEDLEQARVASKQLAMRLRETVEPTYYESSLDRRSIYQQLFRQLSEQVREGQTLVALKVSLGQYKSPVASCTTPVPPYTVLACPWNDRGRYRPGVPVPIPMAQPVVFCALSEAPTPINSRDFVFDSSSPAAPSAVLVEAKYSLKKDGIEKVQGQSACAIVGAASVQPPPSAFVINFPFGVPPQFHRAVDILQYRNWRRSGHWQQAINADVPGNGTLVPLATESGALSPSDAMAAALYHWLRQMGPHASPSAVVDLLAAYWTDAAAKLQAHESASNLESLSPRWQQGNSFLVRDTGAREYAVSNQTGPGGVGQRGIHNAFSSSRGWGTNELAALPLYVNETGNCSLPGHVRLDTVLIRDFLESLHRTNLSGIQAMSIAAQARHRADLAIAQLDRNNFLSNEELRALTSRMGSLAAAEPGRAGARSAELLRLRSSILQKSMIRQSVDKEHYLRIKELAAQVEANGQRAAVRAFEIGLHMAQFTRDGLYRVGSPSQTRFALGKKLIFTPHTTAISQDQIYAAAAAGGQMASEWMRKDFNVLCEAAIVAPSLKTPGINGDMAPLSKAKPLAVVLSSQAACSTRQAAPSLYLESPFTNLGVSLGQLLYYVPDALLTGDADRACWSVLVRDLVAYSSDSAPGLPAPAANPYWCQKHDQGHSSCPGLAAEFQIRTPLPLLNDTTPGAYLTNPLTRQRIALIPPIPAEMI